MLQELFIKYSKNIIQIGRNGHSENDVQLEGSIISRKHCSIEKLSETEFKITDHNSKNGTFINGQLLNNASLIIGLDDVIVIGKHVFTIGERSTKITALSFEGIEKIFPNNKIGFHSITASVSKGDFMVIMGPSGCGKSTLLKAIAGVNPAELGSIKIDGIDFYKNYHLLKYQIGYVPQEDILHKELTVYQSLFYSYSLWNKQKLENNELKQKILHALKSVNINDEEILNRPIANLSGGQRKRIAIATELLFEPKLLLLDEPTSPLDPETVNEFLGSLKKLSEQGITILMVTHKPEDLAYATKVLFMGTGGYTCYFGKTDSLLDYFNRKNIIEVYAQLSNTTHAAEYYKKFNTNYNSTSLLKQNSEITVPDTSNYLQQLYLLTKRYFICKTSQKKFLLFNLAQAPLIAFLLSLIFTNVTVGILFMMVITSIWFGVSNATREIVDEAMIYQRERMYGLKIAPYILSKLIVLNTINLIQIVIFSLLCYTSIGNNTVTLNNYSQALIVLFFSGFAAILLGLFLSAIVKTGEQAIAFMPLLLIPQVILAGVIHPIQTKTVDILSSFTFSRWGTEALAQIQGNVMVGNNKNQTAQIIKASNVLDFPDSIALVKSIPTNDIIIIGLLSLALFVGICIALKKKDAL